MRTYWLTLENDLQWKDPHNLHGMRIGPFPSDRPLGVTQLCNRAFHALRTGDETVFHDPVTMRPIEHKDMPEDLGYAYWFALNYWLVDRRRDG